MAADYVEARTFLSCWCNSPGIWRENWNRPLPTAWMVPDATAASARTPWISRVAVPGSRPFAKLTFPSRITRTSGEVSLRNQSMLEMPHHLLDRRFRREAVQLHENVRLAVLDKFVRPADALDRGGDAGVVQQLDHAAAEAIV